MSVPQPNALAVGAFDDPDETKEFGNGRVEIVQLGNTTVKRATLNPGWRWSEDSAPTAGTERCQQPHAIYVSAGRIGFEIEDGPPKVADTGETAVVPPGHDAWVDGEEPAVYVDFA